jgi:eukaryotic-like serine/threonine-protein kinase
MFHQEARIAALLSHRNIVRVLEHDRDPMGRLYVAMEFVDGIDLDKLRQTGPIPHAVIIFVLCEVLEALDFAHDLPPTSPLASSEEVAARGNARGIVHRDVSHHNVLISWLPEVKLSDFGIAKLRSATAADGSKMVKGKAGYMAPEQARASNKLDERADLWAIGVMLWELLTGQPLFNQDTFADVLAAVLYGEIVRPGVVCADVPADLDAITMRLLQREPSERYRKARDVIAALRGCAAAGGDGRAELARLLVARFPERALPVSAPPGSVPYAQPEAPSSPGRRVVTRTAPELHHAPWLSSTTGHAVGEAIPAPRRRARRWPWLAALGVTVATFATVALVQRGGDRASTADHEARPTSAAPEPTAPHGSPAIPPANGASPTPPSVAAAAPVTVTVTTDPTGASVRIETANTPIAVAPSPVTVHVARGTQLRIRAELDGFEPVSRDAVADQQRQAVILALTPRDAVSRPAKTVAQPGHRPAAPNKASTKTGAPTAATPVPEIIE